MPTEKVIKLLHEIKEAGVTRITFHGGDPLMHPDFGVIVREARKCGFFITISVRETLIRKKINDLKYADIVFVSFDGNQRAHDAQKGKGSFKELMEAFKELNEHNINFQTTTVVTKLNKDDIDFIIETAKRFNFKAHFQTLQFPANKKANHSMLNDPKKNPLVPLILSKEDYTKIGKKLLKLKSSGNNIATSKRIINMIFLEWPEHARTYLPYRLDKSIKCWAGLLYNNIAVTGELFPCNYYNPSYYPNKAPNVFKLGFAKALEKNIRDGSCETCQIPCYMELNAMFSLNMPTILNWMPAVLK